MPEQSSATEEVRLKNLAALRSLSSTDYVLGKTLAATRSAVVFSPVIASFSFVNGLIAERYFNKAGQSRGQ